MKSDNEKFYKKGYEIFDFKPLEINSLLSQILDGDLKKGFSLNKKYEFTADLRPNVIDYSADFLKVLVKNNIKNLLRSRTLRDLTLYHAQIRTTTATHSYMDWHRDTYFDGDRPVGMMPPGIKIIYYPSFSDEKEARLDLCEGSHRTMIDNRQEDMKLVNMLPKCRVFARNDQAIMFDTSILHAVVPDMPSKSSIRLIYSFVAKEQLPTEPDNLHFITSRRYEELF